MRLSEGVAVRGLTVFAHMLARTLDLLRVPLKERVVLASFPDFDDQTFSVAREAHARGIEVVVVSRRRSVPPHWQAAGIPDDLRIGHGWSAMWATERARWICFTHGFFWSTAPRRNQLIVNLWHGVPFKRVGVEISRPVPASDFVLASSPTTSDLVQRMYSTGRAPEILPIGLPRNDLIRESSSQGRTGRKRIAWLPTYRHSTVGEIRDDGWVEATGLGMSIGQLRELDEGLANLGMEAVLKPHPMTELKVPVDLRAIRLWNDADWPGSLYKQLGQFDALLTDYSSVALDFAISEKPVFLLACDRDKYQDSRGLFGSVGGVLGVQEYGTPSELLEVLGRESWPGCSTPIRDLHANVDTSAAVQLWDRLTHDQ